MMIPAINSKVSLQLNDATIDLAKKLAPLYPTLPPRLALPALGLKGEDLSKLLRDYKELPSTKWEGGRVSGAVYCGKEELGEIWKEAYGMFAVSNPLVIPLLLIPCLSTIPQSLPFENKNTDFWNISHSLFQSYYQSTFDTIVFTPMFSQELERWILKSFQCV